MSARFYFATCQNGSEKAVKAEVLDEFPRLKFAFSRPGFITFKEDSDATPAIPEVRGVFVRLWGQSVSQAKDMDALLKMVEEIPNLSIVHLFERDPLPPGSELDQVDTNANIQSLKEKLPEALQRRFRWNAVPKNNDMVYDLIWIDDFHVFLGKHIHLAHLDPAPGNQPEIKVPAHSPSRAYLKIEEAIHRFKPKLEKGMQVLEVGCSPGGATVAMIARGLQVTGVDPKFMDPQLNGERNFRFIQKIAKVVTAEDLRNINPDWIVMDMNIAPLEAIDELAHVIQMLRKNWAKSLKIKHGFLTIKLNDWKFSASIPLYMKRLHECGFRDMVAMQMVSNRQEFFVYAGSFSVSGA